MAEVFDRLFRPAYGTYFKITPKAWWSRHDRRSAKIAAFILDADWPAMMEELARQRRARFLYGTPVDTPRELAERILRHADSAANPDAAETPFAPSEAGHD